MIFVIFDRGGNAAPGDAGAGLAPDSRLARRQAHDARVATVFGELDRLTRGAYVIAVPPRREP